MKSPLIVMLAVTGKPTEQEIVTYLGELKENGIEQFMIYPRSGCELEYMGEEWLETVSCFLQYAKRLHMSVWLYDEFNWPSGDAGGKVTAIEEFRLKAIRTKGEEAGRISSYSIHNAGLFGEKFFPDVLSEKAMDYFMECTHNKYYERFQDYFGTVIKGIFTDEPSPSYCCFENDLPYYEGMEDDYQNCCGRDFYRDMNENHEEFCQICMELVAKKFRVCFIERISRWCEQHGILMTGHLVREEAPFYATKSNGNILESLSAFSMPGIDEIETDFGGRYELSLLGNVEYACGQHGAMAELFALGPCDMTYAKKRCMLFLLACFKVDHYFLAVSPMDLRGNMKIMDYFNCFNTNQPDFAGTRFLAEEARLAAQYAQEDYTAEVLVRYPLSLCARHMTGKVNDQPFVDIINRLSYYQIQWKYIQEGEACEDIPVIEFTEQFEYCCQGIVTTDTDEICRMCKGKPVVTEGADHLPEGIFVRKFNNGSFLILNLQDTRRALQMNGAGFELEAYGVLIADKDFSTSDVSSKECIWPVFDIHYCNKNVIRAMFLNGQAGSKIQCEQDMEVVFAVRKGIQAGMPDEIVCKNRCDILPKGFQRHYAVSDTRSLKRGEYTIVSEDEYKYMPSVFVSGEFAAETITESGYRIVLSERRKQFTPGELFSDYGKVELTARVMIPEGVMALFMEGTKLYTCVYLNDTLIGERIYAPYRYPIDRNLWGKAADLKIVQYSSMGPIFGGTLYYDMNSDRVSWKGTPPTGKAMFGVREMGWIYE